MSYVRLGLLLIGAFFFLWGSLIMLNTKFYEWWRDRYWKEPNNGHLSRESLIYNRYVEGGGEAALGAWIIYCAIFLH
jgi:hypothetical protein